MNYTNLGYFRMITRKLKYIDVYAFYNTFYWLKNEYFLMPILKADIINPFTFAFS